jgi:hypothetical protein
MKEMDNRFLALLSDKPDLIGDFPDWMLSPSAADEIRAAEGVAIAEIAGRDSIAAVIRACELRPIKAVVPTIAYTGTEYGRWKTPFEKTELMKERLEQNGIKVFDPVVVGSPKIWWALCGKETAQLIQQFGFLPHCVGCHLYFHAIRIPLAKKLGTNLIIGGERESHDGKIKINQIKISLDAYEAFVKKFDIELLLPLRHITSGEEIEAIIGMQWDEGEQQLECVLSKNYRQRDGSVIFNEKSIIRYFSEFASITAEESIKKHLSI